MQGGKVRLLAAPNLTSSRPWYLHGSIRGGANRQMQNLVVHTAIPRQEVNGSKAGAYTPINMCDLERDDADFYG